jgi:hypothetical protein
MRSFQEYLNEQKLKGNQKNLDVNKNGKVDAQDFKMLRAKSGVAVKKEYVDDQGKLIEKPETKKIADYNGSTPKSPPDKGSAPYKAANDNVESPTVSVDKDGLANLGDQKLKYEPNTESKQEIIKTKTEHFLNKTKNMSLSEFTKYMLDECGCGAVNDEELPYVTAYTTGKFQPHPPEAIKYVVVLANKNDNVLDNVVHEIKNAGMLGKLMKILMSNPEAYEELTNLFGDATEGPNRCKMFAKSMNGSLERFVKDQDSMYESVSKSIGFDDEMEDDDDMDMEDDDDMDMEDDDDMDMEDDDMEDSDEMDMDDDEMSDDMEDSDEMSMDDEEMSDDMEGGDEMSMDDDDFNDEDFEDEKEMPKRKLKKKFAHHNLLSAMKQFKSLGENFTRDDVMSHPDMNNLKKYLQDIEVKIDQAEKSKNAQELNNIKKDLEYQMRDNKMALSKMNPQDRQRNVYLSTISANLQAKWEYVSNVINRVQSSMGR